MPQRNRKQQMSMIAEHLLRSEFMEEIIYIHKSQFFFEKYAEVIAIAKNGPFLCKQRNRQHIWDSLRKQWTRGVFTWFVVFYIWIDNLMHVPHRNVNSETCTWQDVVEMQGNKLCRVFFVSALFKFIYILTY